MKITKARLKQIIVEEIRKLTEVYSEEKDNVHASFINLSDGGRNKVTIKDLAAKLGKDVTELQEPGFFDGTGLRVINGIVSELI